MEDDEFHSAVSSTFPNEVTDTSNDVLEAGNSTFTSDLETQDGLDFVQINPIAEMERDPETTTYEKIIHRSSNKKDLMTPVGSKEVKVSHEMENISVKVPETVKFAAAVVHAQYAVRYIGSARLPEGDLIGDRSSIAMTQCITTLAKGPRKSNKVIQEFKENQKLILKFEDRELKLITDEKNPNVNVCHPLNKIRAWAIGKEADSHHFAYVIRSPDDLAGYSYICRVFKCSVKAREVASALRNICMLRAAAKAANSN